MNLLVMTTLFITLTALAAIPSTSCALVVARSASAGFANGCATVAGVVAGDLIFVGLAITGMSVLADMMGGLFVLLRCAAGAYLIWFGINLIRARHAFVTATSPDTRSGLAVSFLSGLLLTLGDVKAILFYASLFPAFIDLTALSMLDMVVIALLTIVSVGGVKLSYAWFATLIVSRAARLGDGKKIRTVAGSFMVGAGSYLILKP